MTRCPYEKYKKQWVQENGQWIRSSTDQADSGNQQNQPDVGADAGEANDSAGDEQRAFEPDGIQK